MELPAESFAITSVESSVAASSIGAERKNEPLLSAPLRVELKSELSSAQAVSQGRGVSSHEMERREGGGGIMNTTHSATIRMSPQEIAVLSCKEAVGNVGPGRNKNARGAGCRDKYVPSTPPLRDRSCKWS